MYAGLIKSAFAPVTECEIGACFGTFFRLSKPFKDLNALGDQVLRHLLATSGLICAAQPSGQSANPEQHLRLSRFVEIVDLRWSDSLGPKLTQGFASCFILASFLKLLSQTAANLSPLCQCKIATLVPKCC